MENKSLRKLHENITKGSNNSETIKIINDEYMKLYKEEVLSAEQLDNIRLFGLSMFDNQ